MNTEDQSAASDVSEQTEPTGEVEQQTATATDNTFASALLQLAKDDGHTIGESEPETPTPPADEPTEQPTALFGEPDGEPAAKPDDESEEKSEDEPEEKPEQPKVERKSIEEQIAEAKAKGEKPAWYLSRIAEETEKRERHKTRAESAEGKLSQYEQRIAELEAQVTQSSAPRPTADQPLIDVFDYPTLQRIEGHYEKILEFAEKNRDGATEVVIGKDKEGKDVVRDFTPEEISEMRYKADRAVRKDIPQRRAFLSEKAKLDQQALDIYPELKDPESNMTQEALTIIKANPALISMLGPEATIWIGHALRGRELYLKRNGNGSTSTQKIVKAAQTPVAPTPTRTRSIPDRRPGSVNVEKARQKFNTQGDEDAALELVGALLNPKGGPQTVEPIGE